MEYENIITDHLSYFIQKESDRLLTLPISILRRIIVNYSEKFGKKENNSDVRKFIFKII